MTDKAQAQAQANEVALGFGTSQGFTLMQRAANLLAQSTLVPKEYQGNLPNCVIALNMANRMGSDPLMVMQNLYIVHGRPGWSSQFLISTFNTSGRFSALRYEWVGEEGKDTWGCRAWAIERSTGEKLVGSTITIGLAKKEGWYQKTGSKWQTMPQQMLMYRSAAWFVRAYAPEIAMGMHTTEELGDIVDVGPTDYEVVEEIRTKANSEPIDITPPVAEAKTEEPKPEPKAAAAPKKEAASKQQPMQATLEDDRGPGF